MKNFFNSLYWKISAVFLLILMIISAVYIYISVITAEMYFQETRQKLDLNVASHIASDNDFFSGDSININVLKNVFHNVMVINPSIEVYLLDTTRNYTCLLCSAADGEVKRRATGSCEKIYLSATGNFPDGC